MTVQMQAIKQRLDERCAALEEKFGRADIPRCHHMSSHVIT